jgi:antitoxin component HigA of HigAB toxin-antitoxin module
MDRISIDNILKVKLLQNELEHERATSLFLRLRIQIKVNHEYQPIREHLKNLILQYEGEHWSEKKDISDELVKESDQAELIVQKENEFYYERKKLIKKHLKKAGLNQNDLAAILGHRKSYMSELINGLRPFSKEDSIILNRLFKLKLDDLIPTFINQDKVSHINDTLKALNKGELKLSANL